MSSLPDSEHFAIWILQQQQMVMMLLGKIANPMTGKTERDLDAARWTIDLIGAVQERTKGNLNEQEERLLAQVVTNLRLNFVHEANQPADTAETRETPEKVDGSAPDHQTVETEGDSDGDSDGASDGDSDRPGAGDPS